MNRLSPWWVLLVASVLHMACGEESSTSSQPGDVQDSVGALSDVLEGDLPSVADIEYKFHTVLPIPDSGSLADPHVIKVGDTWYLYATHSQTSLEVWYSDDLAVWTEGPTVWSPTVDWQTRGDLCGIWAPHVEPVEAGFYLYYTANCRIGVAHSDSPLGPFEEVFDHPIVGNGFGGIGDGVLADDLLYDWDDMAIDAFLLQRDNGKPVLYFTALSPLSELYATPMEDFTTLAGSPQKLLSAEVNSWEGIIREGAWVFERDGLFTLMYSGNQYDTMDYAMGVATASSPLGPFTRDPRNPLLKTNAEIQFYAPGHHSVAPGAHDDFLIFYHTKVDTERNDSRRVRYGPLWFDEDGVVQVEQP